MKIKIALAGNPNSGKTTLFNTLTGSNQFVGNWPGVTVEKKEGKLKNHSNIIIADLPGIYSLSPYTTEEIIARNYLTNESPDIILNIIDGSNLERNLYLTTQLAELGIPMVVAINMSDIVTKKGDKIDTKKLSLQLGCPVVPISALKKTGTKELIQALLQTAKNPLLPRTTIFSDEIEEILSYITSTHPNIPEQQKRFYAIKLFEKDEKITSIISLNSFEHKRIETLEKKLDDDVESIITNERYNQIVKAVSLCYTKAKKPKATISDKIDKIVTNKYLALPIFALIMFAVYYVSVTTVGSWATDWTNDVLFGEIVPPAVENFLVSINTADWLIGLIVDGIIAGVGAVLGFVPQLLVLFAFLAFLEACGYMARIAFIMDRIFRKLGLSGKSFIPMLIGTGCGVPGIMASRTIESEKERRMTIMTTTFIPCSAKLPIIALIAGALFNGAWWVAPSAYFVGIIAIIISGVILKKTKLFAGDPSPFVMELPPYHLPTLTNILKSMWERGWSFIKKAGTIILLSSIILWFMLNYGVVNGKLIMVEDLNDGILASLGSVVAPLFSPLGWGSWEAVVAAITGLIAKENVVNTFGIIFGFAEVSDSGEEIWTSLATHFTMLSSYSFLVFNLLCAPCFAAIGAIKREMNNGKWTAFAIAYQTIFAYVISLCIYQIGTFIATGIFNTLTLVAIILIVFLLFLLFRPQMTKSKKSFKAVTAS